ncbi:MAG: hypothetical protein ACT4N4_01580 [Rhodospirillales bacterium]
MRKTVAATVRMHKWRLEERARVVDELERLREKLLGAAAQLEAELGDYTRGRPAAANSGYVQAVGQRRERIAKSLADVEAQMDQARRDLAEAFEELKKYEAALANRERMRQKRGGRGTARTAVAVSAEPAPQPQRRAG